MFRVVASVLAFSNIFFANGQTSSKTCPEYDYTKIKLVTFDCFAALMSYETSMLENVANILPSLSSSQVQDLVIRWEDAYGAAQGTRFDESITGAFPFSHFVSTELKTILADMNISVTRTEYDKLVKSWGDLKPWTNSQAALRSILAANISVAALSNGDRYTLTDITHKFADDVKFSYIFPSDFPAGVFKPQREIYDQVQVMSGLKIEEILHVAGGGTDASGARDAGLFSVLTHSVRSYTGPRSRVLHDSVRGTSPCFFVGDISEVPSLLGL